MKVTTGVISCLLILSFLFISNDSIIAADHETLVKENQEKLLTTKSCRGCDLRGLNLNRADLSGADLEEANLEGAKLYLCNLSGANLKNSILRDAGFGGADLSGADLRGADLAGASLGGAYMENALFDSLIEEADSTDEELKKILEAGRSQDSGVGGVREEAKSTEAIVDETSRLLNANEGQKPSDSNGITVVRGGGKGNSIVNKVESPPTPKKVKPLQTVEIE